MIIRIILLTVWTTLLISYPLGEGINTDKDRIRYTQRLFQVIIWLVFVLLFAI